MGRVMLRAAGSFAAARAALPVGARRATPSRDGVHPEAQFLNDALGWCERVTSAPTRGHARMVADIEPYFFTRRPPRGARVRVADVEGGREYAPAGGGDRTLLFFHGGGWVQRSVRSHDPACRLLAALSGVRIVSCDYRLAPEHPFPAAADDCLAHYERHSAAPGGVHAVGGDSAGANLAASVLQAARDRDLPLPRLQWLLYPVVDCVGRYRSDDEFGTGFNLTTAAMQDMYAAYLPDASLRDDRRASPLLGDMSGLPPAYVATAHADPLRDQGAAYAARLHTAGVPVTLDDFPLLHGFLNFTAGPAAMAAVRRTAAMLRAGVR